MAVLFAVEFDDDNETTQPLIVRYMYKLADLYSSPRFQRYLRKYSEKHIPHALLVQLQTVFASFANVLSNTKLQNIIAAGGIIPRLAYDNCNSQFEDIYRSLKRQWGVQLWAFLLKSRAHTSCHRNQKRNHANVMHRQRTVRVRG